jgi:hypothetical protein
MVKGDHWIATLAEAINRRAVDKDQVQLSVVITIKETYSSARGINNIPSFGGGDVRNPDTCILCNVLECGNWRKGAPIYLGL